MSLMNDALRKNKKEKKHPSGTDFLKEGSQQKPQSKVRTYGIAVVVLLACTMAGFYLYEMISLSGPMAPAIQAPLVERPRSNLPERPLTPALDGVPTPPATPLPTDRLPEGQIASSQTVTRETASPASKAEKPEAIPARTALKNAEPLLPEKKQEPTRPQKMVSPPTSLEPEEASPRPESITTAILDPTKETVPAVNPETDSVEELFYRKGLSYHRQNKIEMAIQMYKAVLKKNPDHRATRFNLASAYIQVAAFTEADTILQELNLQKPDDPDILLNLAAVEIGLDRPEKALIFLERAAKEVAAPTFEILFHKGAAFSRMGDFEAALKMYQKAERLAPENPRLRLNTAIAYDSLAQYNQAIDHYQMFLDRKTSLTTTERREIETRVRELKVYLAQEAARTTANPQTESGQ